jgi:hypothetical protein
MANNKDFKLSDYGFFSRNHFSKKIYWDNLGELKELATAYCSGK